MTVQNLINVPKMDFKTTLLKSVFGSKSNSNAQAFITFATSLTPILQLLSLKAIYLSNLIC